MNNKHSRYTKSLIIILLLTASTLFPQSAGKESLAFKKKLNPFAFYPLYIPEYSYQFLESFSLVQKANHGDPSAQLELSIRFLTGDGFDTDTLKAVYWMKKSAAQELPSAKYNLGIFTMNGWGCDWNPFEAYSLIKSAANNGMVEAEYLTGVFFTENLTVQRNYDSAGFWFKKADAKSFKPAKEALTRLEKMVELKKQYDQATNPDAPITKPQKNQSITNADLDFINESLKKKAKESDTSIFRQLIITTPADMKPSLGLTGSDSLLEFSIDTIITIIKRAANAGSPEANVFIGRCCEAGIVYNKSVITAAAYYILALHLESPYAGYYINKLISDPSFNALLNKETAKKHAEALYVYSSLQALNADGQEQRNFFLNTLRESEKSKYIPAIIELAEIYFRGKYTAKDSAKAFYYWAEAEKLGSKEAMLSKAIASMLLNASCDKLPSQTQLTDLTAEGSVLSLLIQGYLFESGKCIPQNKSKAVECYRKAAFRGNSTAFSSLKRLYDELRPFKAEFTLTEE